MISRNKRLCKEYFVGKVILEPHRRDGMFCKPADRSTLERYNADDYRVSAGNQGSVVVLTIFKTADGKGKYADLVPMEAMKVACQLISSSICAWLS